MNRINAVAASAFALAFCGISTSALALPVNETVPDNLYITQSGLDWAWASPCAPTQPTCGTIDLSFQSQFGWRLPTTEELSVHPTAFDFEFTGGGFACAARYFSTTWTHCDWGDGLANLWAGLPGGDGYWETLVVRAADLSEVPIPGALPLFASALGLGGLFGWKRKRKAPVVTA